MTRTFVRLTLLFLCSVVLQASAIEKFLDLYGETRVNPASNYYTEVGEHESGHALFLTLSHLIQKNHKANGYGQARSLLYNKVDNYKGAVSTLYSGLMIPGSGMQYLERGDQNQDGYPSDFVNCEHIWPQSKFNKALPMRADMHHLYPTLAIPNNKRGSYPFGMVDNPVYQTSFGSKLGYEKYEPADQAKGNVARAVLYFFTRYHRNNIFYKTNPQSFFAMRLDMLVKWHQEDPVDSWERKRNEEIFKVQGNRNPFIDHPEFVERIGKEGFLAAVQSLKSH